MAAIELGCQYTLQTGGSTAVLNAPGDPNYVGLITDITGLDMYGVRENAQQIAAGDGGYHGPFWRDRRPFTIAGFIQPTMPVISRDQSQDKLIAAVANAMRQDGKLLWTPADNVQKQVLFRAQQPVRITKGQSNVEKVFLLSCVSRDWRITSTTMKQSSGSLGAGGLPLAIGPTNDGNADAAPIITIRGPINWPIIQNVTTGKQIAFYSGVSLGSSANQLTIDLTGVYPVITIDGSDFSGQVDAINSDYTTAVSPGTNAFHLISGSATPGTSAATYFEVDWYDSWH